MHTLLPLTGDVVHAATIIVTGDAMQPATVIGTCDVMYAATIVISDVVCTTIITVTCSAHNYHYSDT